MKKIIFYVFIITAVGVCFYINFIKSKEVIADHKNDLNPNSRIQLLKKDTLLNTKSFLVLGTHTIVKQIKIADTIRYKNFFQMAWFNDEVIIANRRDDEDIEIYLKRSSIDLYEKYKVPVYQGVLKEPDFTSNPEAKMFVTRIKEGCKSGVNFAGHYTLIYWGCGTACQYGVIVDRKTGNIYEGYMSSIGSEFKKNSSFIIFNADDEDEKQAFIPVNINRYMQITLKVWEENVFKTILKQ